MGGITDCCDLRNILILSLSWNGWLCSQAFGMGDVECDTEM